MWLKSLELMNFRQFHGCQKLNFSPDESKGITVVHGENGSGKTTLLNAFKWGFYEVTSFDTGEDNLLNERAIFEENSGNTIPMHVEIEFSHEQRDYKLKRLQNFKKTSGMEVTSIGNPTLELSYVDENGKYKSEVEGDNAINKILPEKLHTYFFFNGERIEKLSSSASTQQISEAIKNIMGLEIIERAIEHLEKPVKKKLRSESRRSGGQDLEKVTNNVEKIAELLQGKTTELSQAQNNLQQYEIDYEDITERLKLFKESSDLQAEEGRINDEIVAKRDKIRQNEAESRTLISKNGFLAFFNDLADEAYQSLEGRRKKGELPYKIKPQFVEDLLEIGKCICGTEVPLGSDGREKLEQYKSNSIPGLEDAFNSTTRDLATIGKERGRLFSGLERITNLTSELNSEIEDKNKRIEAIKLLLDKAAKSNDNVAGLVNKKKDLELSQREELKKIGFLEAKVLEMQAEQKKADAEHEEVSKQNQLSEKISKKIQLADEAKRVIGEIYDVLSEQTRTELSELVNKIFKGIIRKQYWAEIDEDYTLQIYKEMPNGEKQLVPEKSTGESQITSLSFIASIIKLAKEKSETENNFFRGGIYPIVMDSPFGSLDDEYRELVAGGIPDLAGQIILFASSSQWKGEVERACKQNVSNHISLIYHGNLKGEKSSIYKKESDGYEYTLIEDGYYE